MRIPRGAKAIACAVAALTVAVGATSCSSDDSSNESSSSSAAPSTVAAPLDVDALKAKLPESVKKSGTLTVATHTDFAPMMFTKDGKQEGIGADLLREIGKTLGLKVEFKTMPLNRVLAETAAGKYDLGAGGIFDTKDREKTLDFVTYFRAGTQWARRTGTDIDPYNACGKKVGAEKDTVQFTLELPNKSKACEVVGEPKIDVVGFDSSADGMKALTDKKIDAFSQDSPVTLYAAKESKGKIEPAGHAFDTLPYAYPMQQKSPLAPVFQQVIQHFIDDGQLKKMAEPYGIERGVIKKSSINAAVN